MLIESPQKKEPRDTEFEIIGPDGQSKWKTYHKSCMPPARQLAQQRALGYKFKLRGKAYAMPKNGQVDASKL